MPPVRTTQRAPLSCAPCAARKIKCTKDIPCRPCIARGTATECRREIVRVRGKLRTADSPRSDLSYAELLHENAQLSALICDGSHQDETASRVTDANDRYEADLWTAVGRASEPRRVREREAIHFPSKACSHSVITRASIWTSWIHYAFFFPHFQLEHDRYWEGRQRPDTLWFALYFSVLSSTLLFMDDAEFTQTQPPVLDRINLLKNWYEAALYYLDEADFMQTSEIRVVQAVTILGIVATNIGDTARHSHLWSVAIRMAQALRLGTDSEHQSESLLQREVRRRLWWTLIICEWLPIPTRHPCISASDFNCELPREFDDQNLIDDSVETTSLSKPVQYHIAMSKVAVVVNRFRATLHAKAWSATQVAQIVSTADDELASLIVDLPPHLRHDDSMPADVVNEQSQPWIAFQRRSLTLVLLHHRIVTNRVLQGRWLEGAVRFDGSRSMCLSSAVAIIHVASNDDADFSRLRPWALAMHVFCALVTLVMEAGGTSQPTDELLECIDSGLTFLDQVQSDNVVAKEGLKIVRRLAERNDIEINSDGP